MNFFFILTLILGFRFLFFFFIPFFQIIYLLYYTWKVAMIFYIVGIYVKILSLRVKFLFLSNLHFRFSLFLFFGVGFNLKFWLINFWLVIIKIIMIFFFFILKIVLLVVYNCYRLLILYFIIIIIFILCFNLLVHRLYFIWFIFKLIIFIILSRNIVNNDFLAIEFEIK